MVVLEQTTELAAVGFGGEIAGQMAEGYKERGNHVGGHRVCQGFEVSYQGRAHSVGHRQEELTRGLLLHRDTLREAEKGGQRTVASAGVGVGGHGDLGGVGGARFDMRRDCAQLDAMPVNLDLGVLAAEILQSAVGVVVDEIAGFVKASRPSGEFGLFSPGQILNKRGLCLNNIVQVSTRDQRARNN